MPISLDSDWSDVSLVVVPWDSARSLTRMSCEGATFSIATKYSLL